MPTGQAAPAVSHGTGSSDQAMLTARPVTPNWAPVRVAPMVPEWRADRPALVPWLMPDTMRSGWSPNPLDAGQDDRQGRGALDPEGGHVLEPVDLDRLVGDGLPLVDPPDGGPGPAVVHQGSHHQQLVLVAEGVDSPRARAAMPAANTPSSLVTRMRMVGRPFGRGGGTGPRR